MLFCNTIQHSRYIFFENTSRFISIPLLFICCIYFCYFIVIRILYLSLCHSVLARYFMKGNFGIRYQQIEHFICPIYNFE